MLDKILVKAGAKIDTQNKEGKTALYRAAQLGHIQIFYFLASRGANVNLKLPENAETPSYFSMGQKSIPAIKMATMPLW